MKYKVIRTVKPDHKDVKNLKEKYGDDLLNVRYLRDEDNDMSIKTVELIVSRQPYKTKPHVLNKAFVYIRVKYEEKSLQYKVKSNGGFWDKTVSGWRMPISKVKELGLEDRIMNL